MVDFGRDTAGGCSGQFIEKDVSLFRFVPVRQLYPHGDAVRIGAKMRANPLRAGSPALPPWGCCTNWRKNARQSAQLASIRRAAPTQKARRLSVKSAPKAKD